MVLPMKMVIDSWAGELIRREGDALAAVRRAAHEDLCKSDPSGMFDDPQVLALFRHAEGLIAARQRATIDEVLSAAEAMQ